MTRARQDGRSGGMLMQSGRCRDVAQLSGPADQEAVRLAKFAFLGRPCCDGDQQCCLGYDGGVVWIMHIYARHTMVSNARRAHGCSLLFVSFKMIHPLIAV